MIGTIPPTPEQREARERYERNLEEALWRAEQDRLFNHSGDQASTDRITLTFRIRELEQSNANLATWIK